MDGKARLTEKQKQELLSIDSEDELADALEKHLETEELRQLRHRLLSWNSAQVPRRLSELIKEMTKDTGPSPSSPNNDSQTNNFSARRSQSILSPSPDSQENTVRRSTIPPSPSIIRNEASIIGLHMKERGFRKLDPLLPFI